MAGSRWLLGVGLSIKETLEKKDSPGNSFTKPDSSIGLMMKNRQKHFVLIISLFFVLSAAKNTAAGQALNLSGRQAEIKLGEKLFFDPRLSVSGQISCNSCHEIGVEGKHSGTGPSPQQKGTVMAGLTRDLHNNPEAVLRALKNDPDYGVAFRNAYKDDIDPITFNNYLKAATSFIGILSFFGSSFETNVLGDPLILLSATAEKTPEADESTKGLPPAGVWNRLSSGLSKRQGPKFYVRFMSALVDYPFPEGSSIDQSIGHLNPPLPAIIDAGRSNANISNIDPITGMEFVSVPGGCFQMGDNFGDGDNDERPVHQVCLSDFMIGKHEVTQKQWEKVMGYNPSQFSSCGPDCPVEKISWNDIQLFIERLNNLSQAQYRLPTEAEWEYSARSGGKPEKYSGGAEPLKAGWHKDNSGGSTHRVAQKLANGLGLFDMSGNVWEWVNDWYEFTYYSSSPARDPQGPSSGEYRVLRGGSWDYIPFYTRVTKRIGARPDHWGILAGFRLAFRR